MRFTFQSTHSVTECDTQAGLSVGRAAIFQSTHSVTECDTSKRSRLSWPKYFNPRTPLQSAIAATVKHYGVDWSFQSTHSVTECDEISAIYDDKKERNFNPRTPLQSAIAPSGPPADPARYFNPRTPLQSAIMFRREYIFEGIISIHALRYRVR